MVCHITLEVKQVRANVMKAVSGTSRRGDELNMGIQLLSQKTRGMRWVWMFTGHLSMEHKGRKGVGRTCFVMPSKQGEDDEWPLV